MTAGRSVTSDQWRLAGVRTLRTETAERENDGSSSSFRCLLNTGECVADVRAVNKPPEVVQCLEKIPNIKNL